MRNQRTPHPWRHAVAAALLLWSAACGAAPPAGTQAEADHPSAIPAAGAAERLVILHNNDLHFSFHHFGRFRDLVEDVRRAEDHVLLLSGGDVVIRHEDRWPAADGIGFYRQRGLEMMALMNEAGYDAAVLGNHELYVHGSATREILEAAAFPWLAANIDIGAAALPRPQPYASLTTRGGLRVFVLGLSVINFEAAGGLAERNLFGTVRDHLPRARDHDVFVVLSHRGVGDDIRLANEFPEIDVIIGGHTHSLLTDALMVNGVLIAQTGSLGHAPAADGPVYLGTVIVELERGRAIHKCGRVFTLTAEAVRPAGTSAAADPPELVMC